MKRRRLKVIDITPKELEAVIKRAAKIKVCPQCKGGGLLYHHSFLRRISVVKCKCGWKKQEAWPAIPAKIGRVSPRKKFS